MNKQPLPLKLLQVIIIIALPTVTCFGYYAVRNLSEAQAWLSIPLILAYPITLIATIGLVSSLMIRPHHYSKFIAWLILLLPSATLLIALN